MRVFSLLALLSIISIASAQDLAKPIDFSCKATALQSVLAQLSKESGAQLQCSHDLAEEPIILRLNHVPLQEVMNKIAAVSAGEWITRDKALELRRSSEANRRHDLALARKADLIRRAIDHAVRESGADRPFDESIAKRLAGNQTISMIKRDAEPDLGSLNPKDSPYRRLVAQALRRVDPAQLAEFDGSRRLVFASNPTVLQRPLRDMRAPLEEFKLAVNLVTDEVYRIADGQKFELRESIRAMVRRMDEAPSQSILHIVPRSSSAFNAELTSYGSDGGFVGGGLITVDFLDPKDSLQNEFLRARAKSGLDVSERTKEYIALENRNNWHHDPKYDGKPTSFDLIAEAMSPAVVDPLAHATSDLVMGIAEQDNVNVVFLPTDECETYVYGQKTLTGRSYKGGPKLAIEAMLTSWLGHMSVAESDGWLVGSPLDPMGATKGRAPRQALQDLLETAHEKGYLAIEDISAYALSVGHFKMVDQSLHRVVDHLPDSDWYSQPLFAFLATINRTQWEQATNGALRLGSPDLAEEQKDLLAATLTSTRSLFKPVAHKDETPFSDLDVEPTQLFANGLDDGHVLIASRTEPIFVVDVKRGDRTMTSFCNLESLAQLVFAREQGNNYWRSATLDGVRVGSKRTITVKVVKRGMFEDFYQTQSIAEDIPAAGAARDLKEILDNLPMELKAQYEGYRMKLRDDDIQTKRLNDEQSGGLPPAKPPILALLRAG